MVWALPGPRAHGPRPWPTNYADKVKVTKLNVDENVATASRYRIQGIPTLLLFKDGEICEQLVGAQPKSVVEKALQRHLKYVKEIAREVGCNARSPVSRR